MGDARRALPLPEAVLGRSASDLTPAPTDVRLEQAAAHLAHPEPSQL